MHELDHIGIAVRDLAESIVLYKNNFGFDLELTERLDGLKIELAFLKLPNTSIELIAPMDANSPIAKFIAKNGEGLHHVCYKVQDINEELENMKKLGHVLIDEKPRDGARNTLIAFIHPKSLQGVLTELCQYK